ncbi:PAS domain-containing protein [Rubellimicrobium rubrum]|uniref:PAS domain-containing protein n=1 Tax=Rubellimicrobium rubrum TaxID=2585369 RepID=UPI001C3F4B16|nr:PAS domain-containing protein [Rubellimicrobium rubrum]
MKKPIGRISAGEATLDAERILAVIGGLDEGTDPFVAAVRATRMPMIITNPRLPDNPVIFANDAFCRLTGYGRDEILGRNCRFLQGQETDPAVRSRIREAVNGARSIEADIRNYRKNGEPFWNRLLMAPVWDANGDLAYFFASQVDVTMERERLANLETSNAALLAELSGRLLDQQAREEELRFTLEAGRFGAWSLDLTSGAFVSSPTCRETFGLDPERPCTYAELQEAVHPADRPRLEAATARNLAQRTDFEIEFRVLSPQGDVRWVAVRGRPAIAEDGTLLRLTGVSLDITDGKRAQRMREALVRLADAFRDLDDPTDISYIAGRILGETLDVDRAGYGTVDLVSETILVERDWNAPGIASLAGLLHFRDYGSYIDDLARGEMVVIEDAETDPRTVATADALTVINARAVVNVPVVEGGRTVALFYLNHSRSRSWLVEELAFLRDVAERTRVMVERRRAEQALRLGSERLRFLDALGRETAAAPDADAVMAITTRMLGLHMGAAICAYADMDPDEDGFTIRGDWAALGSKSIVGRYKLAAFGETAVRNLRAGLPLVVGDVQAELSPDAAATFGSIGIAATICMPLVKEGRLVALMAVHHARPHGWAAAERAMVRDVTDRSWAHVERARAEAELRASASALRELNETLEQRVQERSRQLLEAEDALRQSQKMEAVGQLTGGLAHDFNNLLTGIGGSLEMIGARIEQGQPHAVQRYLTAAQGAVKRAAALTHRLLAFSRRQTLDPKPTDVNRLVRGMEELIRRTVGPSVYLEVVGTGGLWPTLVDPNQLENALLNLCINARDAMPDGGRLTIETANRWLDPRMASQLDLGPGQYISLSVSDTGTGMSPHVAAKVFEPFFTTKPLGQGTGLGLSMIYGFARQSGGQVRLYSEEGQGTTVSIYLPRHASEMELEVDLDGDRDRPASTGDGEVVLVIDDEPTIRMLVREVLDEAGYAALEAADGPSGLRILQSDARVDLLITDVGLPGGLNGRQVADAARLVRPELKILFITGYAENAVIGNGQLDRDMSIITKPFQMEALTRKIRESIEG